MKIIGVYGIRCRKTDKWYIGSSVDVLSRFKTHKYLLQAGRHHCTKLQRAWNKYGKDSFAFSILLRCEESVLRQEESEYIEIYDSWRDGYNDTTLTGPGTKLTEENKRRIGEANRRAGTNPALRKARSERAKAQHAAGKLGQATWKPGTNQIVGQKNRKPNKGAAKLTEDQVREIIRRNEAGEAKKKLAEEFGITTLWVRRLRLKQGRKYLHA